MNHDDNMAIRVIGLTEKEETYLNVLDIGASSIYSEFKTRLLLKYYVSHDLPRFER